MSTGLAREIEWLYGLQHLGIKLGLENIRSLLEILGHPETGYPSVLVAGTNGKGSVSAMLQAILVAAGLRPGLFTSPHLVRPNERIRIGTDDISDADLLVTLRELRETIASSMARGRLEAPPSFFEVITAAALLCFERQRVDAAVLEVGLGGRLDATNAVGAEVAVVVSVDLDHVQTLGTTVERIAGEKAGIVKPGRPLVSGVVRQQPASVLQRVCLERRALLVDARLAVRLVAEQDGTLELQTRRARYAGLRLALEGRHQIDNARVAVAAYECLAERAGWPVEAEAVRGGLASVRWPGRLQWIGACMRRSALLLDGAHNPAGAQVLACYLRARGGPRPVLLFGALKGKQVDPMLAALAPFVEGAVIARPPVDRAADPQDVADLARHHLAHVDTVAEPGPALERACELAGSNRFVAVAGSLYLVGAILGLLEGRDVPGPVSM
jgi:dihydrofolate synthase/folylpolyglutamate synthase